MHLITKRYPVFPLVVIASFIWLALFGSYFAPFDPIKQDLSKRLVPPAWIEGGTANHLLGTDELGRDLLSRLMVGTRASLVVAVVALLLGGLLGGLIGIVSGYQGGVLDTVLMRAADGTLAFPIILLALLLVVGVGPGYFTVIIAVGIVIWSRFARVIRGEVLSLKERDFVKASQTIGTSSLCIMAWHIFPNVASTLVVMLTLQVGWVIITEAILSFLGAGIPPPTPTWGAMVADGRQYMNSAWWYSFFPGLAITVVVLAFNLVGDWIRDRLDPKLRQQL
jgi:peptide/nickel transport system permease protein